MTLITTRLRYVYVGYKLTSIIGQTEGFIVLYYSFIICGLILSIINALYIIDATKKMHKFWTMKNGEVVEDKKD